MADNEDQKDKIAPVTAPKPAIIAQGAAVVPAPRPKAKPVAEKPIEAFKAESVKPVEAKPAAPAPIAAPKVEPAKVAAPAEKPVVPATKAPVGNPVVAKAPLAKAPVAKAPVIKPRPGPKPKAAPAPIKPKPVAAVVPATVAKTLPVTNVAKDVGGTASAAPAPKAVIPKAAPKTVSNTKPAFAGLFSNFMLEETTMDMSANFTGFKDAMTEAQAKAKAAFEKSTAALGDVSEFAKGNVEACVESGKIYAEGVQAMGSEFVTESRAAFEKMTGDVKELAAAKSPTDFFRLQSELVRKNFDTAVAYSSKNSEAMLKLMSDTFAPISGRVSIAVEKARSASPMAAPTSTI